MSEAGVAKRTILCIPGWITEALVVRQPGMHKIVRFATGPTFCWCAYGQEQDPHDNLVVGMAAGHAILDRAAVAKQVRPYWETVAHLLSELAGGVGVDLVYAGVNEASTVVAGPAGQPGDPVVVRWEDGQRRVQATFASVSPGVTVEDLQSCLDVASHLAITVGRRAELERERRLGSFLILPR